MEKMTFEFEGKTLTAKGKWEGNVFTAHAYDGKKVVSDPFTIAKTGAENEASEEALANAALNAVKDAVMDGSAKFSADA